MKCKQLVLGAVTLASVGLLLNLPVQAADTLGGNSVGEFTVEKGDLTLDSVPTFAFASTNVKDLVTQDNTLAYKDATTTGQTTTGSKLTVSDYRGSDQIAWNLNAKLGEFTNKTDTITGTLNYTGENSAAGAITTADSSVWDNTKAKTAGIGSASADTQTSTTLTIPKVTTASAGTYDGAITWTLSATASD